MELCRYGSLFRTHILGCPTVVCMDPELNRRTLASEGAGFVPGYPQSMLDILGPNNIAAVHGPLHRAMRGAMLALTRPAMIRGALLPKIDAFMRAHLHGWAGRRVDIQEMTKEVTPQACFASAPVACCLRACLLTEKKQSHTAKAEESEQ